MMRVVKPAVPADAAPRTYPGVNRRFRAWAVAGWITLLTGPALAAPTPWSSEASLAASNAANGDKFGLSLAISGNTAIVGTIDGTVYGVDHPSQAYVFVRTRSGWTPQQILTPPPQDVPPPRQPGGSPGMAFGRSVAISGNTAVVAARRDFQCSPTTCVYNECVAYVFARKGTTWSLQKTLVMKPPGTAGAYPTVAISGDTVVVGAPSANASSPGHAYVWVRNGSTWSQQADLTAGNLNYFAYALAISGDTIVVGAPFEPLPGRHEAGAAYVFSRVGGAWSGPDKLIGSDTSDFDNFGSAVAVSGGTVIVGAPTHDFTQSDTSDEGAAYVFVRNGSSWQQQQEMSGDRSPDEQFGYAVSISGETAIVGTGVSDAALIFARNQAVWLLQTKNDAPPGAYFFGLSVGISGETAVVGALGESLIGDVGQNVVPGMAYVYRRSVDSDGDGLPDDWETDGVTIDGEFIDLPAMGADPMHKDVFVHVDVMQPDPARPQYSFAPDLHALKLVSDAFFLAPVDDNPDGKPGIHLHVDAGPNSVMDPVTGHQWGALSRSGTVPFQHLAFATAPKTVAQAAPTYAAFRAINLVPARRGAVFRYALFCDEILDDHSTGLGNDIPGTSFFLGIGVLFMPPDARIGAPITEAALFMHELGHTLGLKHGGDDNVNYKPNYISIMNYRFETIGLLNPNTPYRSIDYSRRALATLDETALDELTGIADPDGHLTTWNRHTRNDVPSDANRCIHDPEFFRAFYPGQVLDWNCDGAKTATLLTADLNSDGKCVLSSGATLSTVPAGDDVVFETPLNGGARQMIMSGPNRTCETTATGGDIQLHGPETEEEPKLLTGFDDWPVLVYDGGGKIGLIDEAFRTRGTAAPTDDGTLPVELPFEDVLAETPPELLAETEAAPLDEATLAPTSGPAPLVVDFDGSASTAVNGAIVDWSWDFGDGATGSGAATQHTYGTPGEYLASLTVTDDQGHVNLVPLRHLVRVFPAVPTPTPIGTPGATPTPQPGAIDASFTATATNDFGIVYATAIQPDGKTIVGGGFESFAGCARFGIARINADGSCDPTFDPGATFTDSKRLGINVTALAVQPDGKILVGVHDVVGSGPNPLVRLNADGTVDGTFDASGLNYLPGGEQSVLAIAVQPDGRIVVGGHLNYSLNGQPKGGLARLESNGSLDTSFVLFGSPEDQIEAVAVQADGKIIFGGTLLQFGRTMPGLGRVNTDGSRDMTFTDPLCDFSLSSVYALALQPDGKLIALGTLIVGPQCDPDNADLIARFEADGTRDPNFSDPFAGYGGASGRGLVLQSDGRVIVSGIASQVQPSNLARLDPNGSLDPTFHIGKGIAFDQPGETYTVLAIALHASGKIVVAGDYNNFDGGPVQKIVQLNPDGRRDPGFDSNGPGQNSEVYALLKLPDDKLVVGMVSRQAQFGDKLNAARRNGVGRLNADGTTDPTFTSPFVAGTEIDAMALQPDGRVLVGGTLYLDPGSQNHRALARLGLDGRIDPDFNPPQGVTGDALAVQADGKIIATGDGYFQDGIVRLNAADGSVDGSYVVGFRNQTVTTFVAQPDGKLLVGGVFSGIGNAARNSIARLNTNGSVDTGFDPGSGFPDDVSGYIVRTIALQADGKILVGGNFLSFNGTARPGIARLNPNGSLDTSFVPVNPNTAEFVGTQGVGAFAIQPDGKIVVGPALTGTRTSPFRLFRLDADGSLDQTFPLRSGLGCDNCVIHGITLQTGGAIVIAGEFDIVDGTPRLALARLLPDGAAPVQTPTPIRPTPTAPSCAGDCNDDRTVAINELVTCVNIALGNTQVASCQPCDADGDGAVKINELIAAVSRALGGCPR